MFSPTGIVAAVDVLVSRRDTFNAAHELRDPGLSDEDNERLFGKCANLHGHNYVLEIVVAGEVQDDHGVHHGPEGALGHHRTGG